MTASTRTIHALTLAVAMAVALPVGASMSPASGCADTRAHRWADASGVADPAGDLRVYAIQYKQEIRHVETYETFYRKMDCLIRDLVLPTADTDHNGKADHPTIVVFDEDTGLATLATGTRGAAARAEATYGPKDPQNIPGALGAFGSLAPAYAPAIAYYGSKAPDTSAQRLILAAATDTFVRGFMRTNSELARTYGVYIVSANNQAEFRETADPAAVAALRDPDLAAKYATGALTTVYEALDTPGSAGIHRGGIDINNEAFLWAPLRPGAISDYAKTRFAGLGPNGGEISASDPRANVIALNTKTPLTDVELNVLDLTDQADMSEANTGPFRLLQNNGSPCTDASAESQCKAKIGFGISLPAFQWGSPLDVAYTGKPCDGSNTWMRCLDTRGVTLFLQPEANSGMWAEYIDAGWHPTAFQALSWLDSAWRAVADSTVKNIRYAVTPHMVGNLVDLTFDGQSVIFERCLPRTGGTTCDGNPLATFVGAKDFISCEPGVTARCDDPALQGYAGPHSNAIVQAPWVMNDAGDPRANREALATRSREMQAGTGSAWENDYLETAVWADLDLDSPS